jgi:hypothetical protein
MKMTLRFHSILIVLSACTFLLITAFPTTAIAAGTPLKEQTLNQDCQQLVSGAENQGGLYINYNYRFFHPLFGYFSREISGFVSDPLGFWSELIRLQAPPGAQGTYGMIGDDPLLGQEHGYGLTQLGILARKYIKIETIYYKPSDDFHHPYWKSMGISNKEIASPYDEELNDITLGWVFFDVREAFESDLKKFLKLPY